MVDFDDLRKEGGGSPLDGLTSELNDPQAITQFVLQHALDARTALETFLTTGAKAGVLGNPGVQLNALKTARDEMAKAIALIQATRWS